MNMKPTNLNQPTFTPTQPTELLSLEALLRRSSEIVAALSNHDHWVPQLRRVGHLMEAGNEWKKPVNYQLVGGWTTPPFEKNACQNGNFPQF